ncbi:DNA repair protein RadC [bacterium]|nr:DNA repair protein RadC [bacterium]
MNTYDFRKSDREEWPRERFERYGAGGLGDEELIALLLGSGTRGIPVRKLAKQVLQLFDAENDELSLSQLLQLPGIGKAKATLLLAAVEFARRRIHPRGVRIRFAEDAIPLLTHWARRQKEHFISLTLNGAQEVIRTRVVTVGLVNSSQIHPREVFADAITDRASAIIVAHNHPSGQVTPSSADRTVSEILRDSGRLLGIPLLDHIIFSEDGFYSFREQDELFSK